jgi:transposase
MAQGLSLDLRERMIALVEGGMSRRGAARQVTVAGSSAIKWFARWQNTGSGAEKPGKKAQPSPLDARGRCKKGQLLLAFVPHGHWKTTTFVAGANLMHLQPYSPDLNPIDVMFSKLKALLRKAAERTIPKLWDRIGQILDQFTPQDCAHYLRHDGYGAGLAGYALAVYAKQCDKCQHWAATCFLLTNVDSPMRTLEVP